MRRISVLAVVVSSAFLATPGLQAGALPATPKAGQAPTLPTISHRPLKCLLVGQFPRVDAGVTAAAGLKSVRVYFRAHGYPDWYYVDMRAQEVSRYTGLLPQPLPDTKQLDYYIGALDATLQSAQTRAFEPEVSSGTCRLGKKPLAAWTGLAKIVLGGTKAGQLAIPPGFSSVGVSAFVDVTGAVTTGSALVQGGGGATTTATSAGGSAGAGGGAGSATSSATSGSAGSASAASSAGSASGAAPATGAAAGGASAGGAAAGAVVAGAAVAAGGAALTTALIIGGGAAVAAGAAVAVSKKGSDSSNGGQGGGSTPQNHAPTATIQLTPTTGLAGFTVISGVAAGVDGDGDALSYAWDLGDGERAAGATVTHVYQRTGTFTLTVTVSDPAGASTQATNVARIGSLTGLWRSPNVGNPPSYNSQWRCVQNADRLDCQSDIAMMPTATGSLRAPIGIDLIYRYTDEYHAFPYNMVDIACSGDVRADFSRFACLGGPGNNDYGMDRIGD